MSNYTDLFIKLWQRGLPINPYKGALDTLEPEFGEEAPSGAMRTHWTWLEAMKEVAADPTVPSGFLVWLVLQGLYYDIIAIVMRNPALSAEDAIRLLHPNYQKSGSSRLQYHMPLTAIMPLLENPAFDLYMMEDPGFLEKVFEATSYSDVANMSLYHDQFREFMATPVIAAWTGPPVAEYTFKRVWRSEGRGWGGLPESIIVYRNGVIWLNNFGAEGNRRRIPIRRSFEDWARSDFYLVPAIRFSEDPAKTVWQFSDQAAKEARRMATKSAPKKKVRGQDNEEPTKASYRGR